ncbi:MAG: hypothetical protein FWE82_09145 [Defluviitaleaceae bacterium]|nr:hypothetical protein [Defluviitaleaceae bacterium]
MNFAAEEYLLETEQHSFMVWRTDPCVMIGQYQVAAAETDIKYAEENNIKIVRRKSGGGAI